jgi:hypothetical protein
MDFSDLCVIGSSRRHHLKQACYLLNEVGLVASQITSGCKMADHIVVLIQRERNVSSSFCLGNNRGSTIFEQLEYGLPFTRIANWVSRFKAPLIGGANAFCDPDSLNVSSIVDDCNGRLVGLVELQDPRENRLIGAPTGELVRLEVGQTKVLERLEQ